jgi:hypothetical protein
MGSAISVAGTPLRVDLCPPVPHVGAALVRFRTGAR